MLRTATRGLHISVASELASAPLHLHPPFLCPGMMPGPSPAPSAPAGAPSSSYRAAMGERQPPPPVRTLVLDGRKHLTHPAAELAHLAPLPLPLSLCTRVRDGPVDGTLVMLGSPMTAVPSKATPERLAMELLRSSRLSSAEAWRGPPCSVHTFPPTLAFAHTRMVHSVPRGAAWLFR